MERFEKTLNNLAKNNLNQGELKEFNRIYYGREDHCELQVNDKTRELSRQNNFEVAAYSFNAAIAEVRKPRSVKIGLIQHSTVLPTNETVQSQRNAIFDKVQKLIQAAASEEVNILCLPEAWAMPYFLCTGEKSKWLDFAENAKDGPTFKFLSPLAKKHKLVIISPIIENDNNVWYNSAVVIDEKGEYLGKHRKNHLPNVGSFNETNYFKLGNTGHPVFKTKYGNIAINICYGRHKALNWLMFALNQAEIVFNPAATISEFGESFWGIEARNAAIANHYITCSINRVGTEEFIINNDQVSKKVSRNYYGSSYMTAPDGSRTPALSRDKDGLLIVETDLNLCRQVKDQWGFRMTGRLDVYANKLKQLVE